MEEGVKGTWVSFFLSDLLCHYGWGRVVLFGADAWT